MCCTNNFLPYQTLCAEQTAATCPAGKFTDVQQGTCTLCAAGSVSGLGAASCTGCAAGHYQSAMGEPLGSCKLCPIKSYSTGSASSCTPHPGDCATLYPGFAPQEGDTSECNALKMCPVGKFRASPANASAIVCDGCPAGSYQDEPRFGAACKACGSAAVFCPAGATKPTKVQRGYVSRPLSAPADRRSMTGQCPPSGMDCIDGTAHIVSGFWLPSGTTDITDSTTVNKCLRPGACAAGAGTTTTCAAGHKGLLCGVCEEGYGQAAGSCLPCPPAGAAHLLGLAFAVAGFCVALTLTRKTLPMMDHAKGTRWRHWLRRKATELCSCAINLGLTSTGTVEDDHGVKVVAGAVRDTSTGASKRRASTLAIARILINYMSMTSLLTSFKLDWGSSLRWLFGIQKVLSGAMPPLMDCMGIGFVAQSVLTLVLPALIVGVPSLLIGLWLLPQLHVQGALRGLTPWLPPGLTLWGVAPWQVLPNAVLTLSFLLWPSLVGSLLEIVDCSVVVDGVSYVTSDLTMSCASDEHKTLAGLATLYLAVLVPAFPLGIAWLLQRNQDRLNDEAFSQRFSFLYVGYKQRAYEGERHTATLLGRTLSYQLRTKMYVWWECVVMSRKFLLVAVTVWFGRSPSYQIYAGVWVLLVAYQLQVVCQPYEDKLMGRLESCSLCAVLGSLLLGLAIALGELSPAHEDAVRTLVALLNISMLVYFALCFVRSARELGRGMKARRQKQVEMCTVRGSVAANPLSAGENPGAPRRDSII